MTGFRRKRRGPRGIRSRRCTPRSKKRATAFEKGDASFAKVENVVNPPRSHGEECAEFRPMNAVRPGEPVEKPDENIREC